MLSDSIQGASPLLLESWKPVVGFEQNYMVTNVGRIYSIKSAKFLSLYLNHGYSRVALCQNGKVSWLYAHQVVAEAFLGSRPEGFTVNHGNGYKEKNWASNLEYMTTQDNNKHAILTGLMPSGERNGHAKVTAKEVLEIRSLYGKFSYTELGDLYGLDWSNIRNIVKRRTWKHIP